MEFPNPKARSVPTIVAAVIAMGRGYTDDTLIGEALGERRGLAYHPRQGAYYADAAGDLGFAYRNRTLTPLGVGLFSADVPSMVDQLYDALVSHPNMQHLLSGEPMELSNFKTGEELSEETEEERISTIESWKVWIDAALDNRSVVEVDIAEAVGNTERLLAVGSPLNIRWERRHAILIQAAPRCSNCFLPIPPAHEECLECQ